MKLNWFWILLSLLAFVVGIVLGISIGTYAVIDHVANGLAGSTFNINLNETTLVHEINKTFYPQMEKIMKERLSP